MGGCIKDISNCNDSCYNDSTVYENIINEYKYYDANGSLWCSADCPYYTYKNDSGFCFHCKSSLDGGLFLDRTTLKCVTNCTNCNNKTSLLTFGNTNSTYDSTYWPKDATDRFYINEVAGSANCTYSVAKASWNYFYSSNQINVVGVNGICAKSCPTYTNLSKGTIDSGSHTCVSACSASYTVNSSTGYAKCVSSCSGYTEKFPAFSNTSLRCYSKC